MKRGLVEGKKQRIQDCSKFYKQNIKIKRERLRVVNSKVDGVGGGEDGETEKRKRSELETSVLELHRLRGQKLEDDL